MQSDTHKIQVAATEYDIWIKMMSHRTRSWNQWSDEIFLKDVTHERML